MRVIENNEKYVRCQHYAQLNFSERFFSLIKIRVTIQFILLFYSYITSVTIFLKFNWIKYSGCRNTLSKATVVHQRTFLLHSFSESQLSVMHRFEPSFTDKLMCILTLQHTYMMFFFLPNSPLSLSFLLVTDRIMERFGVAEWWGPVLRCHGADHRRRRPVLNAFWTVQRRRRDHLIACRNVMLLLVLLLAHVVGSLCGKRKAVWLDKTGFNQVRIR